MAVVPEVPDHAEQLVGREVDAMLDREARRRTDRRVMRELISKHGYDHAVRSLASVVAIETAAGPDRDADARMDRVSRVAEVAVLDALALVARSQGWTGLR